MVMAGSRRKVVCAAAILGFIGAAAPALAQTDGTWNTSSSNSWATASNWRSGTIASGTGATAYFRFDIGSTRSVSADVGRTIGHLVFDDTGTSPDGTWFITSGVGGGLTLSTNSGPSTITNENNNA